MFSYKGWIAISIFIAAFVLGAVFMLPTLSQKDFVRIRVGKTDVVAEIARDSFARSQGLARREYLAENAGMLFVFDKEDRWGIWMKDMRFPLDILWIKDGVLADIEEHAAPPAIGVADSMIPVYRPDVPADFVLEVNAGFVEKHNLKIGDRVMIFSDDPVFRGSSYVDEVAVNERSAANVTAASSPGGLGAEYYIESLRQNPPKGKNFKIVEILESNSVYQKFLVTYEADGLTLTAVMTIPRLDRPPSGWPILILNHGLIGREVYFSGRGSKREQDFFARNGYVTIHPDYRYHARSPNEAFPKEKDPSPRGTAHHDFYVGYTRDVIALIEALKVLNPKLMDTNRIGMWGHSMGGGIAARVMVLTSDVRAYVLFAPLSASVEDNFYELPKTEIEWLSKTYGVGNAAAEIYKKISPFTYFKDVSAPVQLHHGEEDKDVPFEFSEKMAAELVKLGKRVEIFLYRGEGHEFGGTWQIAAERALQFFDRYVKNAR